ncbi:ferritin-like domain-containing protein [Clostridium sp.]|uniref:ferritin-like domain-containing protein n=1 Tax=Clostridium sp. TaxID=1506 RepID=UPI00261D6C94|nr:ferritin-like domain-containing protein [Clostridium sp.]
MFESQINDEQLKEALKGVKAAVQGEREDELFYDYLISVAPSIEDKEIIESIRDDEQKHNKYFRTIYRYYTGMEVKVDDNEDFEKPNSYLEGIKRALFGELRAVEKYREISKSLPNGAFKDVLFEIITDELKHASKYNYLLTTNMAMNSGMKGNMNNGMSGSMNTGMNGNMNTENNASMNTGMNPRMIRSWYRDSIEDKSKFTPDDWVRYITPLVNRALAEAKGGINPEHLYQEFILSGVLVGLGKEPLDAIEQVEEWEKTGESQLLAKSKMNRGYYY